MLLAAFRGKFFQHLGYVVDLFVVSVCLYQELAGKGKGQLVYQRPTIPFYLKLHMSPHASCRLERACQITYFRFFTPCVI